MQRLHIIDSHTGGEPTRLVISGGPALSGSVAEQLTQLREQHDWLRSAVVNEPRGSDVIVGALLCPPSDARCAAGVIFFNNVGYLGMCGHGTIGLMASLAYLGKVSAGTHRIETPVGVVEATLHEAPTQPPPLASRGGEAEPDSRGGGAEPDSRRGGAERPSRVREGLGEGFYPNRVSVRNVPSYRHLQNVSVQVDGLGTVKGDVAWGGNWFFLVNEHGQMLRMSNIGTLTRYAEKVKDALERAGITGANGAPVDHIELFGKSEIANSKSFVLCPGNAYDRSPCGTGTSAKLACLFADGKINAGETWLQESIVGSVFEGRVEAAGERVIPTITGEAFVTADAQLIIDPRDPFRHGIGV
jgi:4-hydroxyproline epimerase